MADDGLQLMPDVIRRIYFWTRLFDLALLIAAMIGIWIPGTILTAYFCLLLIAALGAEAVLTVRLQRLRQHVRANDYKVCPSCACSLRGLRARQPCPECGNLFNAADLAALWQTADAFGR